MTGPALSRREFLFAGFPFFGLFRRNRASISGIRFRAVGSKRSRRRYLVIHGDETTAREVLLGHTRARGGHGYMVESRTRTVRIDGLLIDPNRMFSREGAARNLRRLNPPATERTVTRVLDRLDRGREGLLKRIAPPPGGLLIVLHNNARGYSVETEIPLSSRVHLPRKDTPHEFFLAVSPADFEILAASPYNAVLQDRAPGEDDGSLSRLAAARGWRYVNLECALGNRRAQEEMVAWLDSHLP